MMKTLRFLCLLGALLGLSGCPDNSCLIDNAGSPTASQTSVILVGDPVRLFISPTSQAACSVDTEPPSPETLSVEISDPDNLPVANQAQLGKPPSGTATLQFTPDKQGRYHVFAAFDPVGGIQQFDLYAARNRSAEAPVQPLSQDCTALERTRRGGWLCNSDFWRDGMLVRRFTGYRLAAAGDVVWAVSPTQIMRLVDTGTGLDTSAVLSHSLGTASFLLASADELVILHDNTLQRITFDGTTLNSTGSTSWEPGSATLGPALLKGILLRTGDQLATVSGNLGNGSFIILDVCPFQLQGGRFVRTTASCQRLGTEVVGYEPNALWTGSRFTFAGMFDDLRWLEWTGTTLVEQASLPLGQNFRLTTRSAEQRNTLTPVILSNRPAVNGVSRPTVPVFSPERGGILLELLDTAIPEPSASPSLLWGAASTGGSGVRVRIRPSTP